jgi:CubicO group peptidase (beta-lactamase class C family)
VVPAAWTDASTEPRCPTDWGGQYAYHWWVPNLPGFFNALGHWGQVIYVGSELGLVIVFTGYLPDATANSIYQSLIRDFVVPAVQR